MIARLCELTTEYDARLKSSHRDKSVAAFSGCPARLAPAVFTASWMRFVRRVTS